MLFISQIRGSGGPFDPIELDDGDLRDHPFLDRKAALTRLLRGVEAGILFNENVAEDGPTVFADACRLGAKGIVSKRVDSTYRSGRCLIASMSRGPMREDKSQERNRQVVTAQMNSSRVLPSFQKCQRGGRRESENKRGGRDKPGHDEAKKAPPYGTTMASGLPRCRLTMSLLRAPR